MTTLGRWAAERERAGFAAVGVIDRLVYANMDPLIALAVAAGRTERVDLVTTVLSIGWRNNPILVAKQMASLDLVSGGRLLAGLGLGVVVGRDASRYGTRSSLGGAVALRRPGQAEAATSVLDQIARASSSNATATRRFAGSSTASS
jgi:alkanesulfonate monooxygenase SsuD/methylene tetrahydromethanopterin reductase-like flavin-dependent oxidoreductase (luciferase family)